MTKKTEEYKNLSKRLYDFISNDKKYNEVCDRLDELEDSFNREDWLDMIKTAGSNEAKIAYEMKLRESEKRWLVAFLSKKKEKWVLQRNKTLKGVLVGESISKNAFADYFYRKAIDAEFRKYIDSLIKDMESVYGVLRVDNSTRSQNRSPSEVLAVLSRYKNKKLNVFFKNSRKIIEQWLRKAKKSTDKNIRDVLFKMAGKEISISYDKNFDDVLKLIIERNVQLIKNVSSQTITNIENIVYDAMTTGEGWYGIQKSLDHQKEISAKRVKLIARDQTAKANQTLSELTQREAGVKFFMWRTAQDERVSTGYGGHKQLNNKIYKWGETENYPIIDSYGHRGLPSQRPNCRCQALPVWILQGYEAKLMADGSYEIEKGGYI